MNTAIVITLIICITLIIIALGQKNGGKDV